MKISVVVPAYNEERCIGRCIEAIQNQTILPHEIIVVNNASTDRTASIAKSYGVTVLNEPKKGTTWARNRGFNFATGDVIARTDADTTVYPDWIERIGYHTKRGIQALTGPTYFDSPLLDEKSQIPESYFKLLKLIFGHQMWFGANMVLTKEMWDICKKGPFQDGKKVHEDTELALIISKHIEIAFKKDVIVKSSLRRMRDNPFSFFVEYQLRSLSMATKSQGETVKGKLRKFRKSFVDELLTEAE